MGMQPKMGGKFHLKLNTGTRPIANKYCEGKMKSTLKRELKARETVKREAIEASSTGRPISRVGPEARALAQRKRRVRGMEGAGGALGRLRVSAWVGICGPEAGVGKVAIRVVVLQPGAF